MNFKKICLVKTIILMLFTNSFTWSQSKQNYSFHDPLNIPMFLSGNFGELRSNHFHTGIDIKTQGKEGFNVYAAESGYVSRIKVQHWGYGKAIYITHSNGYTSVYAHIQKFNQKIDRFLKKAQYAKKSYTINLYPKKDQLLIKRGEIIGISGNSGGSGGPHLHFEIRETKTEFPVNPLLFGLSIKDNIKPEIFGIRIYPIGKSSVINKNTDPVTIKANGTNGNYLLADTENLKIGGDIGFSVNTIDKLNGSNNKCGIYSIELFIDENKIFVQEMEKLDFAVNRHMNCHTDYELFKKYRNNYHKSFIQPSNKLKIYVDHKNKGIVSFYDDKKHQIKYVIKDTYGNTSVLNGNLKATTVLFPANKSKKQNGVLISYNKENSLKEDSVYIFFPPNSLYEDVFFQMKTTSSTVSNISPIVSLHNKFTPLQKHFTLKLKLPDQITNYADKTLVVSLDKNETDPLSTNVENGWAIAKSRKFGSYTLMIDTVTPAIKPLNLSKNLSEQKKIVFKIFDNLSGISYYNGKIDGKWALFEYDPKSDRLVYFFDPLRLSKGLHKLSLVVSDEMGNYENFSTEFTWK